MAAVLAERLSWRTSTPRGRPVLPDVYWMIAISRPAAAPGRPQDVVSASPPGTASVAGTARPGSCSGAITTVGRASATMPPSRAASGDDAPAGYAGITGRPARNPANTATA